MTARRPCALALASSGLDAEPVVVIGSNRDRRRWQPSKEFALLETVFKGSHVDPAVRVLETGKVERGTGRRHKDLIIRLAPGSLF